MKTGIDCIDFYVPKLYVSIEDLAIHRDIIPQKLTKGLGLQKMAIPDINEDAASFAANALLSLIQKNNIDPNTIGRVYLGTESALDASKPTVTYAVEIVEKELASTFGDRCFKHCDVVDMTFACVGAVDAFQNCMDWVRNNPDRKAIVIASDVSKYELNSTGEYTQGGGAVAVLITNNPSIISFEDIWGVATKSEGDFFKPKRHFEKNQLIDELANALKDKYSKSEVESLIANMNSNFWSDENASYNLHKEEPVFDGQFSNQCYSDRITEAFNHFNQQKETNFLENWQHLIFHLPYAFHGRRIVFNNWLQWLNETGNYDQLETEIGTSFEDKREWKKAAVKSKLYQDFVNQKIAPGELASSEIGNMYTASIFMSLLSLLSNAFDNSIELSGDQIGFIAYGSGSKSKVFQGKIEKNWKSRIQNIELFAYLNNRQKINIETYEVLHRGSLKNEVLATSAIKLASIETAENVEGLRRYSL